MPVKTFGPVLLFLHLIFMIPLVSIVRESIALGVIPAICLLQGPMQQKPSRDDDVQFSVGLLASMIKGVSLPFDFLHRGREWQN